MDLTNKQISEKTEISDQEKQFQYIFFYGSKPVRDLIKNVLDIELKEAWEKIPEVDSIIEKNGKKLTLGIVNETYQHNLDSAYFMDITFLINACKVVFDIFKAGLEKNKEKLLNNYDIEMDNFHNLFLTHNNLPINNNIKLGVVWVDI